ncbi:MAG TPA: hypothetical protein VJS13_14860 [Pyrinomonadaceae bacterium]|nr:hypothetical protein [Pyrinomonadaceae bacterium]
MKRCPQCLFIYPESDARCDFDNTPLVVVDDAEIDSATAPAPAKKKRAAASKKNSPGAKKSSRKKGTAITAGVALVLGLSGFFVYYRLNSWAKDVAEIPPVASVSSAAPHATPPHVVVVSSPPVENAEPSPTPTPKTETERTATSHSRTTVAPVSTSGPGMGKGGKPVILLTTGGKIDADEVWRTRDGVWYRRAGIVTLLKHNRVKAIVNQ